LNDSSDSIEWQQVSNFAMTDYGSHGKSRPKNPVVAITVPF
jgi:hypothetical protein